MLVPVYNERAHIVDSLAVMRRQRFDGQIEFILVDGGSTDGTLEVLERLARQDRRIVLLHNPHREIPAGLNIALAHARGRWVARMDAHSHYPADYLQRGVERLLRGDAAWVSGPQLPVGAGPVGRATALALATPLGRGASKRWAAGHQSAEYELDSGVFCGVWERATLLELGGWDERWPRNEDSEMAARVMDRGGRLICLTTMAARYTPRDSLGALWRQYLANGFFRAQTARWHPGTLRRSNLLPPALVLAAGAAATPLSPVRRAGAAALAGYGAVLVSAAARARAAEQRHGDAALVPAVLAIMHAAYGLGFLRGSLRHGIPWSGLAGAAGARALARRLAPLPRPVHAPSLQPPVQSPATEPLRRAA